jgi:hypothetical protein
MMKNPFSKIFGTYPKPVPEPVRDELEKHFPNAINVEWEHKKNDYEAIFYLNDIEHIARISEAGELTEYKKNLWPEELPEAIAARSREMGEVMNSIAIFKSGACFHEVIIRDTLFKRKLLLFDEAGNLLNIVKL